MKIGLGKNGGKWILSSIIGYVAVEGLSKGLTGAATAFFTIPVFVIVVGAFALMFGVRGEGITENPEQ